MTPEQQTADALLGAAARLTAALDAHPAVAWGAAAAVLGAALWVRSSPPSVRPSATTPVPPGRGSPPDPGGGQRSPPRCGGSPRREPAPKVWAVPVLRNAVVAAGLCNRGTAYVHLNHLQEDGLLDRPGTVTAEATG